MAITLAPDALSDAEITDAIGWGDLAPAGRLWVRHWPTAVAVARQYVEPAEVPGLAAEALIGTIASIAIGRGPREDVGGFVAAAVRELGADDGPVDPAADTGQPDLFVSSLLTKAFADLDEGTQRTLTTLDVEDFTDVERVRALTVLQHYYLAEHTDRAQTAECRRSHVAMMAVAEATMSGLSRESWLHLSTCAWCTEAFHDVAFSNLALSALIDPQVLARVPASPAAADAAVVAAPVVSAAEKPIARAADFFDRVEDEGISPGPAAAVEPFAHWEEPEPEHDPDQPVPWEPEPAVLPVGLTWRNARGRVLAGVALAAAGVALVTMILSGLGDDGTSPAAAGTDPSATATTSTDDQEDDPAFGLGETPSFPTPSSTSTLFPTLPTPPLPSPTADQTLTVTPSAIPSSTPTPRPTPKPTPKPSSKPTPTANPTTSSPTPTATPTRTCNPLAELLGLCR